MAGFGVTAEARPLKRRSSPSPKARNRVGPQGHRPGDEPETNLNEEHRGVVASAIQSTLCRRRRSGARQRGEDGNIWHSKRYLPTGGDVANGFWYILVAAIIRV